MIVETHKLTKHYNGSGGCQDISLSVIEGHIFGFLGPNGAGKSTFVKTLVGLLIPNGGEAKIIGQSIGDTKVRKHIGYLPELFRYQDWLTGEELLKYHAQLCGLTKSEYQIRIGTILDLVGLMGKEKKKVGTYSKGMQQRIGLAAALINNPTLLFLDEPTSALDPIGRKEVRDIIIELRNQGKTVFLNSHLLSEVETVCDEIAIINNGKLVVNGSWRELQLGDLQLELTINNLSKDIIEKLALTVLELENKGNDNLVIKIAREEEINKALKIIIDNGGIITKIETKKRSLEELFLQALKKGNNDADYN
ncbi:MAG: multidrug ABC transporter ATPase [Peptococcaceae bacterium BICA1-8]|nr:MAG: multidrug ABC transporter ATPase [Peptococcaceae bacterium BICA1-8]